MSADHFARRFQLMLEASLVDEHTIRQTVSLIEKVERKLSLTLDEDNGGAFVNHCALAIQRLKNGSPIREKSENADEIVSQHPELYGFSKSLLDEAVPASSSENGQEAVLIALYLVAMLDDSED